LMSRSIWLVWKSVTSPPIPESSCLAIWFSGPLWRPAR
jgi:hypothetical protein